MATFRIHEDQENRAPSLRQKNAGAPVHGQQKRSVLGAIENRPNCILQGKQSLRSANVEKCDVNACNKQVSNKLATPVVPVAQFEAFKVYEDPSEEEKLERQKAERERIERELRERQRRRRGKDQYSDVYKGTEEDRFVTKREVNERVARLQGRVIPVERNAPPLHLLDAVGDNSPMSVEKKHADENEYRNTIARSKNNKDLFFEMVEYRSDIFLYLREHEKQSRPKPGYMKKQPDITHNMRSILVDWLVEVAEEYELHTETLYLAVNYIDRFLSYMSVVRAKLQLVGTTAMYIAAKYEEIYPPEVGEFVYITDDTYNKRQVTRMEILILRILDFDLSVPTPYTFITAMCITNKLHEKVMHLALYLSELSLLEAEPTLEILPSMMASSAIALARYLLCEEPWSPELTESTGYELKDLQKTVEFLNSIFVKAPSLPQQAIQEKYKSGKLLHVSTVPPREINLKFE